MDWTSAKNESRLICLFLHIFDGLCENPVQEATEAIVTLKAKSKTTKRKS